jgi:hypothetical protein
MKEVAGAGRTHFHATRSSFELKKWSRAGLRASPRTCTSRYVTTITRCEEGLFWREKLLLIGAARCLR